MARSRPSPRSRPRPTARAVAPAPRPCSTRPGVLLLIGDPWRRQDRRSSAGCGRARRYMLSPGDRSGPARARLIRSGRKPLPSLLGPGRARTRPSAAVISCEEYCAGTSQFLVDTPDGAPPLGSEMAGRLNSPALPAARIGCRACRARRHREPRAFGSRGVPPCTRGPVGPLTKRPGRSRSRMAGGLCHRPPAITLHAEPDRSLCQHVTGFPVVGSRSRWRGPLCGSRARTGRLSR